MKPPIVFIVGRNFELPHDGWAKRLQIVTEFLETRWPDHPRYLLSQVEPLAAPLMKARGWEWIQLPVTKTIRPAAYMKIYRFMRLASWRLAGLNGGEVLTMTTTSNLWFNSEVRAIFARLKNAWVLAGRCEFAGFVQYRTPGQRWVMDSNDNVANLDRVYPQGHNLKFRQFLRLSQAQWLNRLERTELALAAKFDRVIAISRDDQEFYAQAIGEKCVFEDTGLVLPPAAKPAAPVYDVGFIGGMHAGAVSAAANLLKITGRSELAHLKFALAGTVCRQFAGETLSPNVRLVGLVDSSLDFLRSCRTVVMMSDQETGTSIKFQEALASGTVVIANRNAARFSQAAPGKTYLEVETQEELCQLLKSGEAFNFRPASLEQHFSNEAFGRRFAAVLDWPLEN